MLDKTAIIIPTRMGSTRLEGKIHLDIGDKPLILHVIDRARETGIKRIYIAVDNHYHFDMINNYGAEAIMTSEHHQSGTDRIYEAFTKINSEGLEYIINLQGDLPFISAQTITSALELFNNVQADIITIASAITDMAEVNNPNVVKIALNSKQKALYFSRAAIPHNAKNYYHHLGVYIYTKDSLKKFVGLAPSALEQCEKLEQLRALENNLEIYVSFTDEIPISVDTYEDLVKARKYEAIFNKK
jgi:3-deoxy-manno-octulosonate cytidylyltransferase (CMP-KDO synthetase)